MSLLGLLEDCRDSVDKGAFDLQLCENRPACGHFLDDALPDALLEPTVIAVANMLDQARIRSVHHVSDTRLSKHVICLK